MIRSNIDEKKFFKIYENSFGTVSVHNNKI